MNSAKILKQVRNNDLEMVAKRHYHHSLSYHNFDHIEDVFQYADEICGECDKEGLTINCSIVYLALLFHDAGYHENHNSYGHRTKESYSAYLAAAILREFHYDDQTIKKVSAAIVATEQNVTPETNEEKVVRAADLFGLAGEYSVFLSNAISLKNEYEYLNKSRLSWANWKVMAIETVTSFISIKIELTRYFQSKNGSSQFEKEAKKNLDKLNLETKPVSLD